ncbi:ribonuclease Z [Neolewinella aurantiaca]|uniref:Ribonuclease Z n=1 Tax=Neolewinella aurantiaca TaxID=2602767 RepID=A0A5C7FL64_9BACT|nr:ribonuclease Z [Neolewinella aurantiaca]TXF91437.1 ribonuclease Z [Neolewinella aurantiaca]
MRFELILLGTSGGAPTAVRNCSAAMLRTETTDVLIDCGENTQRQLLKAGLGMGRVSDILITHLHGDHYFGLAPLLSSLSMQGRSRPLSITSPLHLRPRLEALLELDKYPLSYDLIFHTVCAEAPVQLPGTGDLEIFAFPLQHRIETNGYLLRERQREANIRKEAIAKYDLPYTAIKAIKAGANHVLPDGTVIPNADLVSQPPPPRSYAHCSDTVYFPELAGYVAGVNLLYHEATFLEDMAEDAALKGHSTAKDAARTALAAGVGQLVLGHYSTRYESSAGHENEARKVFPNTVAADDLYRFTVPFQSR